MPRASGTSLTDPILPGTVIMYASSTIPTGWLKCDGAAVSRTTYKALFGIIGTTYGTGDGSTTFNVPNFASAGATTVRFPGGTGAGIAMGATVTFGSATAVGLALGIQFMIRF